MHHQPTLLDSSDSASVHDTASSLISAPSRESSARGMPDVKPSLPSRDRLHNSTTHPEIVP